MSETAFGKIWRYKEERYSSMIAQTLLLSASFRDFLLQQVGHHAKDDKECEWQIETEHDLGKDNRIDILIKTDSCLIGIENKKWAGFQECQLERYSDALNKQPDNSVLVFLSPSRYPPPDVKVKIYRITYLEVINWIKGRLKKSLGEFQRNYLTYLKEYLEELEVSALTDQEIDSLLHYTPCLGKLRAILKATREKSKSRKIEDSLGNYMLASEQIEGVDDLVLFYGFRFSNNWYYSGELLDENSPECLIYLKYLGAEEKSGRIDNILQYALDDLMSKNLPQVEKENGIRRYDNGKCRLAVTRKLSDFKGEDNIVEIENWLSDTKEAVQSTVARFKDI